MIQLYICEMSGLKPGMCRMRFNAGASPSRFIAAIPENVQLTYSLSNHLCVITPPQLVKYCAIQSWNTGPSGIGKLGVNDTGWYQSRSAGITSYLLTFDIRGLIRCYTESRYWNIGFILMKRKYGSTLGALQPLGNGHVESCMLKQTERVSEKDRQSGTCLPSVVPRAGVHQAKWEMRASAWCDLDMILMTETWLTDGPTAFKHMDEQRQTCMQTHTRTQTH